MYASFLTVLRQVFFDNGDIRVYITSWWLLFETQDVLSQSGPGKTTMSIRTHCPWYSWGKTWSTKCRLMWPCFIRAQTITNQRQEKPWCHRNDVTTKCWTRNNYVEPKQTWLPKMVAYKYTMRKANISILYIYNSRGRLNIFHTIFP